MEFEDGIAARTLWGECRGESPAGQIAVAQVIRNRVRLKYKGSSVAAVCLAPAQFSCWLSSDPNRRKMLELADDDPLLVALLREWLYSEHVTDTTFGATHYQVIGTGANWSIGLTPSVTIGKHEFYAGVP